MWAEPRSQTDASESTVFDTSHIEGVVELAGWRISMAGRTVFGCSVLDVLTLQMMTRRKAGMRGDVRQFPKSRTDAATELSTLQHAPHLDWSQLLETLSRRLRQRFAGVDEALIVDAVVDALLAHAANPGSFEPLRGIPFEKFLQFAAVRNVQDRLRSESTNA